MPDEIKDNKASWLEPPVEEEGLRRYVQTIRERFWLVILAVVLTAGMSLLYVLTAQKTYEAEVQLLITPVASDNPVARSLPVIVESVDPTRDVETAAQFVTNIDVAAVAKEKLDLPESPRDLLGRVTAEPVAESNIVAVTAQGDTPEKARDLANAFATGTIEDRTAQVHEAIETLLPPLEAQLDGEGDRVVRNALASQVAQLEALQAAPDPSIRLETEADLPTSQASPRPVLSVAGGLLAGLVLGIAGAFASQQLDPRLRREAQLRRLYRLPILARVPREPRRANISSPLSPSKLSQVGVEAYRTLRSTLESSHFDDPGSRVILVTGPSPSEGKSTTVVNLASSLALAGKKVIVIEADLRRPALAEALDVKPNPGGGVVDILIEKISLEDALTVSPNYGQNLRALLADHEGRWIAELFSVRAAQEMIEEARRLADYVIIDSPPLNEVVDALPLARSADDVLIVVRLGKTRLERLAQLGELLAENGIRPVGFAVVGVRRPGRSEYHYYQGPGSDGEKTARSMFGLARAD